MTQQIPVPPLILNTGKFTSLEVNLAKVESIIGDVLVTLKTWKGIVRVTTTINITLSGTQIVDSVALNSGDLVLVKDQTDPIENGIYLVSLGLWTRATNFVTGADVSGISLFVSEGTLNAETLWFCTNNVDNGIVGTNALVFSSQTSTSKANAAQITTLITTVGTNTTNIATNSADITALTTTVGTNTTNIATNTTDITTVGGLLPDILDNSANITALTTTVGTNTTNIGTNTSDISSLTTAVGTNTTNIGTNTTDIGTLTTTAGTNATNIGTNASNITTLTTTIGTNTTNIATLTTSVNTLISQVAALELRQNTAKGFLNAEMSSLYEDINIGDDSIRWVATNSNILTISSSGGVLNNTFNLEANRSYVLTADFYSLVDATSEELRWVTGSNVEITGTRGFTPYSSRHHVLTAYYSTFSGASTQVKLRCFDIGGGDGFIQLIGESQVIIYEV